MTERVKQLSTKQSQMTIKCEAVAEAGATQASESNQTLANDASAMTIEFLRARLLSERAASKAAREQAQQIAEKVSELQARLDVEIEHRTKAEAAIGKVLRVLKVKGIAIDDVALGSTETKQGKTEIGMSTLDSIKEEPENSEEVLCIEAYSTIDVEMPSRSSDHRDEGVGKDMTQHETHGSNDLGVGEGETETHFDVKNCAENHHGNRNTSPCNEHDSDDPVAGKCKTETHLDVENSVGHHRKQVEDVSEHGQDEVHHAITSMPVLETHQSALECAANYEKELQTGQTTEHRLAIALKLKAMLHQIEKEVEALPKEQPLKLQLQGWVDHVVNMLEEGKEASLNGGLELHAIYDTNTAETCSKIKSLMHTEGLAKLAGKVNAEVIRLAETRYPSVNQMQPLVEEAARKVESDTNLSIVPKNKVHGKNLQRSKSVGYPSTMYSPTCIDALLHDTTQHKRQSSCEPLKGGNRVAFDTFVCHPEMVQYSMSQAKTAHPSMFLNGHTRSDHTGAEWPHLVAAQSPRSDEFLRGEQAHRQWGEANPQARESGLERTGRLRPKEMLPSQSFKDGLVYDAPNDLYMKQNMTSARTAFVDYRNIEFERGHVHPPCQAYMGKGRDPMGFNVKGTMYPTLSLVDDKNGRLRDILTALHVARQHVNDEQIPYDGAPTPNVADAEPYRGYHGDEMQQGPYDYHHDPWRSQAPIIQFPPSPSSEHGYTAFERYDGLRRSSSVSSNFMMPCVETHVQPRGEVQLGNGITLYTD